MDLYGEAEFVVEYLKTMNQENERAMQVHQKMLQESIDYVYKIRQRNAVLKDKPMSTREALQKLQNTETAKKLKNPEKIFKQVASHINLQKIEDENTRLMVGALINIGSAKTEHSYVDNNDLINQSINRLLNVHKESNDINNKRDEDLQHQLHDALAMFDVVDSSPHEHEATEDTEEWFNTETSTPEFLRRGEARVNGLSD